MNHLKLKLNYENIKIQRFCPSPPNLPLFAVWLGFFYFIFCLISSIFEDNFYLSS